MIDPALFEENERTAPSVDGRNIVSIGPIECECGKTLNNVSVAYETWGTLNLDSSNAVLVCHALSGDSHAIGWWDRLMACESPLRAWQTKIALLESRLRVPHVS